MNLFCEAAEALVPLYPSIPEHNDVHPDLIDLMHKCWSGIVEQRPDATLARKITDATLKMYVSVHTFVCSSTSILSQFERKAFFLLKFFVSICHALGNP